jgi:hypothetical protein
VWKEDLRQAYDGTLFWRIREERLRGSKGWTQGFGWNEGIHLIKESQKMRWVISLTFASLATISGVLVRIYCK